MTLVVGGILPQGVFIIADSRALTVSDSGSVIGYFDDIQKAYWIEPYLIGIAGDSLFARLIIEALERSVPEFPKYAPRKEYILASLKTIYDYYSNKYNLTPRVSFIIAALNPSLMSDYTPFDYSKPIRINGDADTFMSIFSENMPCSSVGLLMSISLPSGVIIDKTSYGMLSIGSGRQFDAKLKNTSAYISGDMVPIPFIFEHEKASPGRNIFVTYGGRVT